MEILSEQRHAAQCETLMKSFPADAMKKMRRLKSTSRCGGTERRKKFRSGMIEDFADDVRNLPLFLGRGHGAAQDTVLV